MQTNILITNENYSGLNPIQFGYQNCESSHSFGPAVRQHWLIHFVVSGQGIYRFQNTEYTVKAGEMFVIPPYEVTYYEADSVKPWNYIWIGFTTDKALPMKLDAVISCPEAAGIFNEMKQCEKMSQGRSAYLSARLWDLFAQLLKSEKQPIDYVEKALHCIHSEYMEGITVEEIANRLNLDRSYFSTLFKQKTGISPGQYLLNYRMNVAASLMQKNGESVSVAASSVGYTDIFNFSKMFKKHFGVSPGKYTKNKHSQ